MHRGTLLNTMLVFSLGNCLSYPYSLLGLGLGSFLWGTTSVILTGEPNPSPKCQTTYIERDTLYVVPLLGLGLGSPLWGTTSVILTGEPNPSPTYI